MTRRVRAEALEDFTTGVLESFDLPVDDARLCAKVLVAADLEGVRSHGSARLGFYAHRLAKGLIDPRPEIRVTGDSPFGVTIDGGNGMGQVVSDFAMDYVIAQAKEGVSACATVCNSNPFGSAGYYAQQAARSGLMGVALSNESAWAEPERGSERSFGASSLALAAPATDQRPFLFDASASGLVANVLCTVLSGACGPHCGKEIRDFGEESSTGHFFAALNVNAFRSIENFTADMNALIGGFGGSAPAPGSDQLLVRSEQEREAAEERRTHGIPMAPAVLEALRELARERGLDGALPAPF